MSLGKRKIRPAAIVGIVLIIAVVYAAFVILEKFIDFAKEPLPEESNNVVQADDKKDKDAGENDIGNPDSSEETEIPQISEQIPTIAVDALKPVYTQEELLSMYPDTVLCSTVDAGEDYIDRIYFVGDSTTNGIKHYGVLKDGKNTNRVWTPRSGTLAMWNLLSEKVVIPDDDSEMTIPEAADFKKPDIIVFTLGVNGVSICTKEQFVGYYEDLIDEVLEKSPDTDIILQSIYPVCSDYEYVDSISMEKINRANSWIAELASEKGCYYLNTSSVLVNETGYLTPSYSNGDGIHISPEGFSVIFDYIRKHAIEKYV